MGKTFRPYELNQRLLLPPDMREWLPEGHLALFVSDVVDALDLSAIFAAYEGEERGQPPYHPAMMVKLLVYAYCTGKPSSRKIERATYEDVAYRVLAADQHPDHDSIAAFRQRPLQALAGLFVQVLRLCQEAGLVQLGHVALDGTKIKANASQHKAMSYARMCAAEQELAQEVARLLAQAQAVDADEDARYGAGRRGDELPAELARRESRLAKIRAAKAALEEEAQARAARQAEAAQAKLIERAQQEAATGKKALGRPPTVPDPAQATPEPTAQRNFTDPESRIMKMADGSFHQCFNGQVATQADTGVIVGAQMSNVAPDVGHLLSVLDDVIGNSGRPPRQVVADAGYWSEDNAAGVAERDVDGFIATGRTKHNEPVPAPPRGRIPASATPKERMARKLRTKRGKAIYARRKVDVEPVIGQMKGRQNAGRVRLRGLDGATGEWLLHCLCHNVLKLHSAPAKARLATS